MTHEVTPVTIGEAFPQYVADGLQQTCTVIEIVELPDDLQERERLITSTITRVHGEKGCGIILGKNLADNPKLAPRVNQNALYIFQS